ncbi:hypothetical protein [uncultured phage MedDCM-OCT-S01-C58]|nr:hypothetical protein [uncultured phage MedDCM-OCT-S01-C58]BAR24297.1 Phage tail assembly protein [uncultured Mediterranean phage uvMED]
MVNYRSLTGKEFVYGAQDCFTLICDYYRLMGVLLPDFERPEDLETTSSIFLEQAEAYGFYEIDIAERRIGDVLIMRLMTRTPMHAAIYVGADKILHQRFNSLSAVEPFGRYYRQSVAAVYRYATGDVSR